MSATTGSLRIANVLPGGRLLFRLLDLGADVMSTVSASLPCFALMPFAYVSWSNLWRQIGATHHWQALKHVPLLPHIGHPP